MMKLFFVVVNTGAAADKNCVVGYFRLSLWRRLLLVLFVLLLRPSSALSSGAAAAAVAAAAAGDDDVLPALQRRGPREAVSFDFGWKFRTGLTRRAGPDDEPPTVPPDPGFHPPEASVSYDDDSTDGGEWTPANLPHDGLVANRPSAKACPNGCSGNSYLPRHPMWYRKTFRLPAEWFKSIRTATPAGDDDNDDSSSNDDGPTIWLDFEGSFRNTTVYVNGQYAGSHPSGYTPFRIRIDRLVVLPASMAAGNNNGNNSSSSNSSTNNNVIAVFVDPNNGDGGKYDRGSGWWYEGGGIYRSVRLVRTPGQAHVEQDGLFAYSNVVVATVPSSGKRETATSTATAVSSAPARNADPANGTTAATRPYVIANATITARVTIRNGGRTKSAVVDDGDDGTTTTVCASFTLLGLDGTTVVAATDRSSPIAIGPNETKTVSGTMRVVDSHRRRQQQRQPPHRPLQLWSPRSSSSSAPLYTVVARIDDCNGTDDKEAVVLDEVSVPHGFRTIRFDAERGFFLNGERFKIRGFCDHDTFGVVGMAVPDRINLFRAQASRSVGGNGRRTSHNPPSSIMLDIYDSLGMLVVDENRLFGDRPGLLDNMASLVSRDRNHPSVVIWSFCNEWGCEGKDNVRAGPAFQNLTRALDGTRPTLGNMLKPNSTLSSSVDVQGFSHKSRYVLEAFHASHPSKPIFHSECCSCNTMRSEDVGCETLTDNPHKSCTQTAFNARCLEQNSRGGVNASDGIDAISGTMVWTLFDYYGEPPVGGYEVSSTYGQFDLVGFPKHAAFWFRTQWLLSVSNERLEKPIPTQGFEVVIVESWESPDSFNETKGNTTKVIHAYSNAPFIELLVNDIKSYGVMNISSMAKGPGTYGEWQDVYWEDGKISAIARDAAGKEVARDERYTNGRGTERLVLALDSPSEATGTGNALYLDGQDAALVRASVVDEHGRVLHLATNNVTFSVIDGPGYIQGTGNGDPRCHEPNNAPWHSAYHGLVRAVVRVTSVAGRSVRERRLLEQIDQNGPMSIEERQPEHLSEEDIIVEATSPGLEPVRLVIPTSTSLSASVLAVARSSAKDPVNFFRQQFSNIKIAE